MLLLLCVYFYNQSSPPIDVRKKMIQSLKWNVRSKYFRLRWNNIVKRWHNLTCETILYFILQLQPIKKFQIKGSTSQHRWVKRDTGFKVSNISLKGIPLHSVNVRWWTNLETCMCHELVPCLLTTSKSDVWLYRKKKIHLLTSSSNSKLSSNTHLKPWLQNLLSSYPFQSIGNANLVAQQSHQK